MANDNKDTLSQKAAILVLGKLGTDLGSTANRDALQAVLNAASKKNKSEIRINAIEALGNLSASLPSRPDAFKIVKVATGDKDDLIRGFAIEVLGKLEGKYSSEVLNILLVASKDKDEWVRKYAIEALGNVHQQTIEVLGNRGKVFDAFFNAAKDKDAGVRKQALNALGKVGKFYYGAEVFKTALEALGDQDQSVQTAAKEVLNTLPLSKEFIDLNLITNDRLKQCQEQGVTFAATELSILIRGHLQKQQEQQQSWLWSSAYILEKFWFPILQRRIEDVRNVQEWPMIALDNDILYVVSGKSEKLPSPSLVRLKLTSLGFTSPECVHPLIHAFRDKWQKHSFPYVTFSSCIGNTLRYNIKPPEFRSSSSSISSRSSLKESKYQSQFGQLNSSYLHPGAELKIPDIGTESSSSSKDDIRTLSSTVSYLEQKIDSLETINSEILGKVGTMNQVASLLGNLLYSRSDRSASQEVKQTPIPNFNSTSQSRMFGKPGSSSSSSSSSSTTTSTISLESQSTLSSASNSSIPKAIRFSVL